MPAKKKSTSEITIKFDEIINAIKEHKDCRPCKPRNHSGNAIYCLGMIGAAVYYFQHPPTGELLLTIIKVVLWPAFVAYRLLGQFSL